jgi:hypothetical protein
MCLWGAYLVAVWYLRHTEFAEDPSAPALTLSLMTVTEIAEYLRDRSAWGWRLYGALNFKKFVQDAVPFELRHAAINHDVRFIGTPPNTAEANEINMTYWQYAFFDERRIWDARNDFFSQVSYSHPLIPGIRNYQFGKAPRVDVMRTWPPASLLRKAWTKIFLFLKFRWYWIHGRMYDLRNRFKE